VRGERLGPAIPLNKEGEMTGTLKITAAIACGLLVGGGAVQVLHAQVKPPAYVVAEIAVRDPEGYEKNFLEPTRKEISDHGGKYLAGGYYKTLSLSGAEPPNRVVILQFPNMDAIKAWREQGTMIGDVLLEAAIDVEHAGGSKYASFRVYAVEGMAQ
jgi:uncharacterized protein (DUF1330 family)